MVWIMVRKMWEAALELCTLATVVIGNDVALVADAGLGGWVRGGGALV
jgi:hypothetical protein